MTDVSELTGLTGGLWQVHTQTSAYLADLDRGLMTRLPGAGASSTVNDQSRRLRAIIRCRIGETGYWTLGGGGYLEPESYWQETTVIRAIESITERDYRRLLDSPSAAGHELDAHRS